MGISNETKHGQEVTENALLTQKEIEAEVVYDAFFDPATNKIPKMFGIKILNGLGILMVWLVTCIPAAITLTQVLYNLGITHRQPNLYLTSTEALFRNFSLSTLTTLIVVAIITFLLALYRIYFKKRGYFRPKFQSHYEKNQQQIEDKNNPQIIK